MHIYCLKCKKHTGNMFQKKLVLISNNKIKRKPNCPICSTERTLFHKIEDKYNLEDESEIYLQFFFLFTEMNLIKLVFNTIWLIANQKT